MTMIAKRFKTYISPGNLSISPRKVHCFLTKESALPPRTWALSQGKFISPKKSCIFHRITFLIPWGTC